jgi:cytochrome c-type biogenesis protein CcmH
VTVLGSFRLWVVALIAVAALVAIMTPHSSAATARIAHLESLVRCPSCEDLSVAQSNATTAIAVRHEIVRRVSRGDSDTAILTSLEATYGTSVLLSPPTSGLGVLLWAGPAAILLVAGALATRLVRRR